MGVLVLFSSKQDRHVHDGDHLVGFVKDSDGASKVRNDGAAILVGVHADVARQSALAEGRLQVHSLVGVFKNSAGGGVGGEVFQAAVGAVTDNDLVLAVFETGLVGATVVGGEGAMGGGGAVGASSFPTPSMLLKGTINAEGVHIVAAVAVAEVHEFAVRGSSKPGRAVCGLGVLPEVAVLLPNDGAVESGLCELLVVVGVVKERGAVLSFDLEAVRGAVAQGGVSTAHELGASAVGLPLDEAVLVGLTVVLISQVNVRILVSNKTMAVREGCSSRGLEEIRHVLVPKGTLASNNRRITQLLFGGLRHFLCAFSFSSIILEATNVRATAVSSY